MLAIFDFLVVFVLRERRRFVCVFFGVMVELLEPWMGIDLNSGRCSVFCRGSCYCVAETLVVIRLVRLALKFYTPLPIIEFWRLTAIDAYDELLLIYFTCGKSELFRFVDES